MGRRERYKNVVYDEKADDYKYIGSMDKVPGPGILDLYVGEKYGYSLCGETLEELVNKQSNAILFKTERFKNHKIL